MTLPYEVEGTRAPGERRPADADSRPIGAIVTDLWEKTETLVRQEMKLGLTEAQERVDALKVELDDRVQRLKLEAAAKAVGGAITIGGALALVAAIVLLLAQVMWPWLAALITGIVLCGAGFALLKRDVKIEPLPNAEEFAPKRTIANIKADTHAIQEATHGTAK
ncbi:MAG TPA: phage holin family protein [Polyangiales bacterium]|nr:phage holin family protein [Polyangiales bacterium]